MYVCAVVVNTAVAATAEKKKIKYELLYWYRQCLNETDSAGTIFSVFNLFTGTIFTYLCTFFYCWVAKSSNTKTIVESRTHQRFDVYPCWW